MMSRETFIAMTGREPQQDDLNRVNCEQEGEIGHGSCGWCHIHNAPRFQCVCLSVNDWRLKMNQGRTA